MHTSRKRNFKKYTWRGVSSISPITAVLTEDYFSLVLRKNGNLFVSVQNWQSAFINYSELMMGPEIQISRHFLACFLCHKNECSTGRRVYWPNSGIGSQLWVEGTQKLKLTSSPSFGGKYLFHESLGDRPSVWNPDQMTHHNGVRQVRAQARGACSPGFWSRLQAMVGLTGPWAAKGRVQGGNRTQEC